MKSKKVKAVIAWGLVRRGRILERFACDSKRDAELNCNPNEKVIKVLIKPV